MQKMEVNQGEEVEYPISNTECPIFKGNAALPMVVDHPAYPACPPFYLSYQFSFDLVTNIVHSNGHRYD